MARELFQHAQFLCEVREAAARQVDLFGSGPFAVAAYYRTDRVEYWRRTVQVDVGYALGQFGDLMIQFIKQHDGAPTI